MDHQLHHDHAVRRQHQIAFARKNARNLVVMLAVLVVAVLVVYSWQHSKASKLTAEQRQLQAQLDLSEQRITQVSSLNSTAVAKIQDTTAPGTANASSQANLVITGQVDQNQTGKRGNANTLYFDGMVATSGLADAWVQYGTTPTSLTSQTSHQKSGLGEGSGPYAATSFPLPKSSLKPGTAYYYRFVATTKDGKTVYGGIATFSSVK